MTVKRIYSCNLCRENQEPHELIGLYWQSLPKGWQEKSPTETENHVCKSCMSSLQAMEARCGQGFKCRGGPKCSSDHK